VRRERARQIVADRAGRGALRQQGGAQREQCRADVGRAQPEAVGGLRRRRWT
jgi:hypothetical protein